MDLTYCLVVSFDILFSHEFLVNIPCFACSICSKLEMSQFVKVNPNQTGCEMSLPGIFYYITF